jgi:chromosome segregation protein
VNDARVRTVEAIARLDATATECQRLSETMEGIREEQTEIQTRVVSARTEAAELAGQLTALERAHNELSAARDHQETARVSTRAQALRQHEQFSAIDGRVKEARRQRDEAERVRTQVDIELSRLDVEIDQSRRHMAQTLQIDPDETTVQDIPISDDELTGRIAGISERIESLGPVNPLALEEYEHEKQRWDFFEKQVGDLRAAKKALTETIAELNITAGKRFMETFETARMNFQEVFTQLFRGGEADVRLANPDDPLDSPIEIFARPRGKKFIGLRQLSGGERALTALALLFGLYLVKPSPFCILDEVDAPLDDANCGRFLRLVDRFKTRTQFIIVTHNKLTMEAANILYGVTMEQPGVSRIVSVHLKHEGEAANEPALIVQDADEQPQELATAPSPTETTNAVSAAE